MSDTKYFTRPWSCEHSLARLGNELSAFFFKTGIIAKRQKWKHISFLIVIQALIFTAYVWIKFEMDDIEKVTSLAFSHQPNEESQEKLYPLPLRKYTLGDIIIWCEESSPENLKLKEALEQIFSNQLHEDPAITCDFDFDNWYAKMREERSKGTVQGHK